MAKLLGIGALARALDVHENTIRNWANAGKIPFELTKGGQRRFNLEEVRRATGKQAQDSWAKEYLLTGLEEDQVWQELKTALAISGHEPAVDIALYSFTEMLNNAIDHSEGDRVHVSFEIREDRWVFEITDDGIGVFSRVQNEFQLAEPIASIGELTKGKRTSAPAVHTGEGIFFTSKMVARFTLESQSIKWICDNELGDFAVMESEVNSGTRVSCEILTKPVTSAKKVFEEFTRNFEFVKSRPVIKLFEIGTDFVSRSEAKRLMNGLDKFKEVDLDFSQVQGIGQGFADQVFRVWQEIHPQTKLHEINATSTVQFMINRARSNANG